MKARLPLLILISAGLAACATTTTEYGTLAELTQAEPDLADVYLQDGLDRASLI